MVIELGGRSHVVIGKGEHPLGNPATLIGQIADLRCNHRKSRPLSPRTRGLHRGIQREDIGLPGKRYELGAAILHLAPLREVLLQP